MTWIGTVVPDHRRGALARRKGLSSGPNPALRGGVKRAKFGQFTREAD